MGNQGSLGQIQAAANLIKAARYAIALTGAGSSTPSGVPDFRSSGSGLWSRFLPMEIASLSSFRQQPERFFEWLRPLASHMLTAQPNPAHIALAELEQIGVLHTVITQNIDVLHQRAGSRNVLEVHGTFNTLTCIHCYQQVAASAFITPYLQDGIIPRCAQCQTYLKPDVVLFEEQLPAKTWLKARQATKKCDLMIVAGTSLVVAPVAQLPEQAKKHGAYLIIINQTETYMDPYADIVIRDDVSTAIPAIAREVQHA